MKKTAKANKFALFIIFLGLLVTGADLFSTLKGWNICPFQGCKLALTSSYSSLLGLPLTLWGFGFFLAALFLWFVSKKWMLFWSALGLGAAIYFIYVQKWVLGKICPMCLVVEALVFLLFLSSLTRVPLWCLLSLIILSFLGLNAAYTWTSIQGNWCIGKEEKDLVQKYYTVGKGSREAAFFFSLECPACARVLPRVRDWARRKGVKVVLREVRVHKEEDKALYLYSLIKGRMDPWKALALVEKSGRVPGVRLAKEERRAVLRLLEFNGRLLEGLGMAGVPVLLVVDGDRLEGGRGIEGIERLLGSSPRSFLRKSPSVNPKVEQGGGEDFLSPGSGICTPQGCD